MTFKFRALTLGCFAAMSLAGTAHAVKVAGDMLEVYGNLYPQLQNSSFDDAAVGSANSTMTRGLTTPGLVTAPTTALVDKNQLNWVNSYIGFKGTKAFGDVSVGYNIQGVVMSDAGSTTSSLWKDARDAYLSIGHKQAGTLQVGQMDSVYKQFGDRVRLLGVSSGNFISTSNLMSNVGWRSGGTDAGTTSFNTRINGQLRWVSPKWAGVQVGASYRPDPNKSATREASLNAYGVNWSNSNFYAGLAHEVHNDYRAFSGTGAAAAAANIRNTDPRSKDTATRLSLGYTAGPIRVGADMASLKYTENASAVGKFSSYSTNSWQISGEYKVMKGITVGANYAKGAAGSCAVLGGGVCTTTGQGGSLLSLGGRYDFDQNIGVFALYGKNSVNHSARYASGNTGGDVTNMSLGLQVKF